MSVTAGLSVGICSMYTVSSKLVYAFTCGPNRMPIDSMNDTTARLRKALRAVERHVLDEVREPALVVFFHQRAGVDDEPELGAALGFLVGPHVVADAVRQAVPVVICGSIGTLAVSATVRASDGTATACLGAEPRRARRGAAAAIQNVVRFRTVIIFASAAWGVDL